MARGEASSSSAAATSEVGASWDQSSSSSTNNSSGGSSPYSEAEGSRHPVSSSGEYDERHFDPNHSSPDLGSSAVAADRKSSLAFVVDFGGENSCGLRCTDELSKYLPKRVQERVRRRESTIRNKPDSKKDPAREGLQSKRSLPRLREQQKQTKCDPKIRPGVRKSSPAVYLPTIPSQNCNTPKASRTKNENPGSNQSRQSAEPLEELGGSPSYTIINASGEEVWNGTSAGNASRIDEEDEMEAYEGRDIANNVLGITDQSVSVKTGSKHALQGSNSGYKNQICWQKLATGGWYRKQDLTAKPLDAEMPKATRKWTPTVTRYEGTTNNNARSLADRSKQTADALHTDDVITRGAAKKASSGRHGSKYGAPSASQPLVDRCQAVGDDCRTTARVCSCPTVNQPAPPPPNTRTNRTFRLRCAKLEAARNSVLVAPNHLQGGAKCVDACSATAGSSFTSISSRDSASMARGFLQHGATASKTSSSDLRCRTPDGIRGGCGKFPAANCSMLKTRPLATTGSRTAPKTREQGTPSEKCRVGAAGLPPEVRAWHRRHQNPGSPEGKGSYAQHRGAPGRQCPPEVSSTSTRPGFGQDCLLVTLESNKSPALLTDLSQKIEKKFKEINMKIGILNTLPGWTSLKENYYMIEKNLVTTFSNTCQLERHIADVQLALKLM